MEDISEISRYEAKADKIEQREEEQDVEFGSREWFDLPTRKERFDTEKYPGKLKRLEKNQKAAFIEVCGKEAAKEHFAMFFTELMNDKVNSIIEYAEINKIEVNLVGNRKENTKISN